MLPFSSLDSWQACRFPTPPFAAPATGGGGTPGLHVWSVDRVRSSVFLWRGSDDDDGVARK